METTIQNQIIDYFSLFEEFYNTTKVCLKDCQNYASSINKLLKRCRNIKTAVIPGTPLEKFKGLQSKLCASINNLISIEIQDIKTKLSILEDLFEKLCNKHRKLLESCKDIDFKNQSKLVTGTPLQPSLKQLLEFVEDTITFGSQIIAQIDTSLHVLTYKGLNTPCLVDNFKISTNWQRRVPEIISYTSFCSENQI